MSATQYSYQTIPAPRDMSFESRELFGETFLGVEFTFPFDLSIKKALKEIGKFLTDEAALGTVTIHSMTTRVTEDDWQRTTITVIYTVN